MPGNTEVSSRELIPLMKSLILTIIQKELLTKNLRTWMVFHCLLYCITFYYYIMLFICEFHRIAT